MPKLDGKIAVVTGATSGLALASARLFAAEGAHVFITGRRQDQLDAAVKEIGRNVTGVHGGAGNLDDPDRLFETVKAEKGRLDVLFLSAAIVGLGQPLEAVTPESFDSAFNVNVRGVLFAVQRAVPLMTEGGSIIMTGSLGASMGMPGTTVYAASKTPARSFARTWTAELKDRNIRVNVLSPGAIDTPAWAGAPREARDAAAALIPLGRLGEENEIATAALFLASQDSSYVTGIELFVDGGMGQV